MRIETVSERDGADWDGFVAGHHRGTLYHKFVWRDLVARLFGHETYYAAARDGSEAIVGVLPLVRLRSLVFGDFLISFPYVNFGGALAVDANTEEGLMEWAAALGERLGVGHIEFRDDVERASAWQCRTDKVLMELPLPESADILFKGFGSKLRAQIRRPGKEGAQVVTGGAELLPEFYGVFARNMRDLGTPVYPRRFFTAIADAIPENVKVAVVRLNGECVAAGFLLCHGRRMEIPWASSLREYNRFGVNMLLYWEALRVAIDAGCDVFDFGRSTVEGGTYRFKKQWGAVPRQLYWHYWMRSGQSLPGLTPSNPKYRLAIRVWQKLPLMVANTIGPWLVRNLP